MSLFYFNLFDMVDDVSVAGISAGCGTTDNDIVSLTQDELEPEDPFIEFNPITNVDGWIGH